MNPFLLLWIMVIVVLSTGVGRYLIGGILLIAHPAAGSKKDYTLRPSVAVLLPCFNEGQAVYDTVVSIVNSDYPDVQIIVCDDCSTDDSWYWIKKAETEFKNVKAVQNEVNSGKTHAIFKAFDNSESDVVIVVDSDTLISTNAISEAVSCFGDPTLGIVGAPVGVRNPNVNTLTVFQTYLYYLGFRLGKMIESATGSTGCIGGYFLVIKRHILAEVRPDLEARNWFGVKVRDGEDRYLTHQVLLKGYSTYTDMKIECTTFVPTTFKAYWGQQIRWRRSNMRDFFYTLPRIPSHVKALHPMGGFVYVLTPLVMFIGLIFVAMLFLGNPSVWLDPRMCMMYIGSSFLILLILKTTHPKHQVENPIKLVVFGVWWVINNVFLTPYALLTFDSGDWGNRDSNISTQKDKP